jgi:hypothetical protein
MGRVVAQHKGNTRRGRMRPLCCLSTTGALFGSREEYSYGQTGMLPAPDKQGVLSLVAGIFDAQHCGFFQWER